MTYIIGAAAGLVWGLLGSLLNMKITKNALDKNTTNALLTSNVLRMIVDIAVLGIVFLLRNILPFSFMACIIAAAFALSTATIFFSLKMTKK